LKFDDNYLLVQNLLAWGTSTVAVRLHFMVYTKTTYLNLHFITQGQVTS